MELPSKPQERRFSLFKDPFPKDPLIKYADFGLLSYSEETDSEFQRQLKLIFVVEGLLYCCLLLFFVPVLPLPYHYIFIVIMGLTSIDVILRFRLRKGVPEKKFSFLVQFLKNKHALSNYYNDVLSIPNRGKLTLHTVGLNIRKAYRDRWDGLRLLVVSIILMIVSLPFSSYAMEEIQDVPYRINLLCFALLYVFVFLASYPCLLLTKEYFGYFLATRNFLYELSGASYSFTHQMFVLVIISCMIIALIPFATLLLFFARSMVGFAIIIAILLILMAYLKSLYRRKYRNIMRFFLHSRKDFVKVLDLVALKQVAKDPDWFRHDEKHIVQLCQRYSVDPKIFSNIFTVEQYLHKSPIEQDTIQP
ncbi:MAG: hypothetical protein SFY68_02170 [Candidatus Sumerlaeia bacterium]|nr:hypothetical protein [Candidatus Sumerlaeia bacterium]